MDNAAADDPDSPPPADEHVGYLTLVARVWVDRSGTETRIRGSLTDPHTGAQLPLDLTALVAFVRQSIANTWGGPVDQPPH